MDYTKKWPVLPIGIYVIKPFSWETFEKEKISYLKLTYTIIGVIVGEGWVVKKNFSRVVPFHIEGDTKKDWTNKKFNKFVQNFGYENFDIANGEKISSIIEKLEKLNFEKLNERIYIMKVTTKTFQGYTYFAFEYIWNEHMNFELFKRPDLQKVFCEEYATYLNNQHKDSKVIKPGKKTLALIAELKKNML